MTKTIVYLAHPDVAGSSSQQFLQQSGLALTEVSYVDLQAEYEANGRHFDAGVELARLTRYDRVIFPVPTLLVPGASHPQNLAG